MIKIFIGVFVVASIVANLDRLTGFEQGAVDYIAVPIVPRLLRARVRVFVELYRKTRELERLNGELRGISNQAEGVVRIDGRSAFIPDLKSLEAETQALE